MQTWQLMTLPMRWHGAVTQLQQSQKAWHEDASAVMIVRGCQSYFRQLGLAGHAMSCGKQRKKRYKVFSYSKF